MEKTDMDAVVATVWPFGWAFTALSKGSVVEVTLHEGRPETEQLNAMDAWWDEGVGAGHGETALLDVARRTARWWKGPPPALAPWGSAFQRSVWIAVAQVPPGKVVTYGALAASMGRPSAVRAVAGALAANRAALWIPCHRVGPAGGDVGGFRWGPRMKAFLRDWEASGQPVLG